MEKDLENKSRKLLWIKVIFILLAVLIAAAGIYGRFGGFGTGPMADKDEFKKYAASVEEIAIPEGTKIVALGEATHGNREFQELKLSVFITMVENQGIRAFALEADAGCCTRANEYIHGGSGTAEDAAAALGFQIYRTKEMAELLNWMREYNESAPAGEDIILYGFDMQRYDEDYEALFNLCRDLPIDMANISRLSTKESDKTTASMKTVILANLKEELSRLEGERAEEARHFADILLQNIEVGSKVGSGISGTALRDKYMAENVLWILDREAARGNDCVFMSGHNGHMEQSGVYDKNNKYMGTILSDALGQDSYFSIGTDFYKGTVNMPTSKGRTTFTVYSHDPMAKAAKKAGFERCWVDFSQIPQDSPLRASADDYCYTASLGENQLNWVTRAIMRALPRTYRSFRSPSDMYDGMIYVPVAHPTEIAF